MEGCFLCKNLGEISLIDEGKRFCCHGCLAVFTILKTKGELSQGMDHPLVKAAKDFGIIASQDIPLETKGTPKEGEELLKLYLEIQNLWCPSCAEIIRFVLMKEKGVKKCVVDFSTDIAFIEYQPLLVSKERIFEKILHLGYFPALIEDLEKKREAPTLKLQLFLSSFLAVNLMMLSTPIYVSYLQREEEYGYLFALLSFLFALPGLFLGFPVFKRALQQARFGFMGMEALVSIGVVTAFILSSINLLKGSYHVYFDSMSVVLALLFLGKSMERKAKFSAKESLIKLMRAIPKRARKRFPRGTVAFVSMKEIHVGDILLAHKGEKIALDGEVVEGEGTVDESLMTGEVKPIKKREGSKVIGGTFVQAGFLAFRVLEEVGKGTLQKIVDSIEQDLHKKKERERLIDTVSKIFVPIALMLALCAFCTGAMFLSLEEGFNRLLSVILIACPCAIGIAVPLVESSLLTALSSLGIIVQNRSVLSLVGSEDIFLFDKTGTVTEGKFEVIEGLSQFSKEERALIKSVALLSLHPIALALDRAISEDPLKGVLGKEIPGYGIEAAFHQKKIFLGSREFLRLQGILFPEEKGPQEIATEVFIALIEGRSVKAKTLILGDRVKEGVRELVKDLKKKPIKTVLLSGDGEHSVSSVAKACFFDAWKFRCHPLEKRRYVEELQKEGSIVAMVGDGINDAPALTLADIAISFVRASDISSHVSDILLTSEHLFTLHTMRSLVQRGKKLIKQNLFWAFFYNILGVGMAFLGLLTPLYAAGAMAFSSLICVFNAKRL